MKKNLELCEACKQNPVHKIEESNEANQPQNFLVMNGSVQIHENRLDEYVDFINTNNFTDVYINDLRYSLLSRTLPAN